MKKKYNVVFLLLCKGFRFNFDFLKEVNCFEHIERKLVFISVNFKNYKA